MSMYVRRVMGVKEMKKRRKNGSILQWTRIGLGRGDLIHPGVRPGKGVFTHGGLSSFAPRACVSMFEFTMLSL